MTRLGYTIDIPNFADGKILLTVPYSPIVGSDRVYRGHRSWKRESITTNIARFMDDHTRSSESIFGLIRTPQIDSSNFYGQHASATGHLHGLGSQAAQADVCAGHKPVVVEFHIFRRLRVNLYLYTQQLESFKFLVDDST